MPNFCRMKREVDRLSEHLAAMGFAASGLHGDMEQMDRDSVIKSYRRTQTRILVATDVAARGLDVKDVTHVFNYHIPFDPQSYVHRIGRTGRAGKSGQAITLVSTGEFKKLQRIQKEVGAEMRLDMLEVGYGNISQESIDFMMQKLDETAIHPDIDKVLQSLSSMDQSTFIKKALSHMISQEQNSLGFQIGYSQSDVDNMLNNHHQEQKNTGSNKRKKRRR